MEIQVQDLLALSNLSVVGHKDYLVQERKLIRNTGDINNLCKMLKGLLNDKGKIIQVDLSVVDGKELFARWLRKGKE